MDDPRPHVLLSEEEPLADYLKRRERELMQHAAAIRSTLAPVESQLEDVRRAMKAIGVQPGYVEQLLPYLDQSEAKPGILNSPLYIESLTIKEMVLRALSEHFNEGATPSELSEYMRRSYRRDVDRNSISPQLARLREEGLVENTNALSGKWQLTLRGSLTDTMSEIDRAHSARRRRWYGPEKKD
jgi:hypothetical protein